MANGLVKKVLVVDSIDRKLTDLRNIAGFKKVDYIILKEGTEIKLGMTTVYYFANKVKIKNQSLEFEIEVDN